MAQIGNDVLVYDIETRTYGMPDANRDKLRLFGCYSYKTQKFYLLSSKDDIQKVINAHKFLVGFNTENYDEPIIKREGIDINYKIRIDLYDIFKKRSGGMKIEQGMLKDLLMSYSLDYISKTVGVATEEDGKLEIDYKLFQKDSWTPEETELIKKYTYRDVELTKKLYEWTETYFEGFREFMSDDDVKKKRYLTVSIAKFAYKSICKSLGWTEEYGQHIPSEDDEHIAGGYVAYPAGEEFKENIYALDFSSLYPHIMIQCNLFGRKKEGTINDRPIWSGGGVWKTEGVYYADELSGVGKLLRQWYFNRLFYRRTFMAVEDRKVHKMKDIEKFLGKEIYAIPKGSNQVQVVTVDNYWVDTFKKHAAEGVDKREYTIKIIINTIYGILNTAHYSRVFDMTAGGDCTRIGRQWIKYARKTFRNAGYKVIYTDTDSIYVQDPFNDKAKVLEIKQKIINDIKATVPFPQDTFDMALEADIKYMFFFKGGGADEKDDEMDEDDFINKPLGFMKKNYIYVTYDGKLEIKNLGIRKKSNSPLSRKIFWEHLVPQIKEGKIKFSKTYLTNLIRELLDKDISLATMRKEVGPSAQYANAPTTLQAQISNRYGEGIHFLIPNNKGIGIGKGKSFCTLDEFKKHNLKIENIDLENVFSELSYFTKAPVTVNIFQFS